MNKLTRLKNWFQQTSMNSPAPAHESTITHRPTIKTCIEQDIDTSRRCGVREFVIVPNEPYVRVQSPSHLRSNTGFNEHLKKDILRVIEIMRPSGVNIQLKEDSKDGYPRLIVN